MIFGWANSVHVHRWAEGIRDRDYEVKVISLDGWSVRGCETVIFPRKGRWSYITHASAAAREALAFKPDLIHVHYVTGFGLWGMWSRFSPMVMSVWGADVVDFPSNWWRRRWIKYILGKASHITTTSVCSSNPRSAMSLINVANGLSHSPSCSRWKLKFSECES